MDNKLYLVTGASGSGKTTLMRSAMNNELLSFTTRKKRNGEIDGVDYIFIDKEEFYRLDKNNGLIEKTEYGGNFYGLMKDDFETKISKGDAFFICDFNGSLQMKEYYDNCETIFIYSEKSDIEDRMRKRGDSEENIKKRLYTYDDEVLNMIHYDHVIINRQDKFKETLQDIIDIIGES